MEKGEKEKEYEKTKGKKSDYERIKQKRTTTCHVMKEENRKNDTEKETKNNKRRERNSRIISDNSRTGGMEDKLEHQK